MSATPVSHAKGTKNTARCVLQLFPVFLKGTVSGDGGRDESMEQYSSLGLN
jgi:hypothetical protein